MKENGFGLSSEREHQSSRIAARICVEPCVASYERRQQLNWSHVQAHSRRLSMVMFQLAIESYFQTTLPSVGVCSSSVREAL